ncbi:MAG: glycosyltransferase family 2 protein [Syntrophorhabdales bacterium]|jgi:GT2 family glycosyltransferase
MIIKETGGKTVPQPGQNIFLTRSNVAQTMLDDDAPLVTVYVMGYNRLERTKTCVECVLKYTTGIDHELILVDNGSTDNTVDFFESVPHARKKVIRITKNIGAAYAADLAVTHARGKYVVGLANDVYVTTNWLSNMLACAMSDDRIGMVSPLSSNVSNFQNADIAFGNFAEMQAKAADHNVSDPRKWRERLRIITLGTLYRKECLDMIGKSDYGFLHDFADDDLTFRIRRAGYKAVLCGDVFVHHDHDLLKDRDPDEFKESLEKGRLNFKEKYFGIDAWDDVNNYEPVMMSLVNPEESRGRIAPQILGIDVLCGTPILELKNRLRMAGVFDGRLAAFTSEAKYNLDLQTICDGRVCADRPEYLRECFNVAEFDYIVLGQPINTYGQPYKLLGNILPLLKNNGRLLVKLRNTHDIQTFLKVMGHHIVGDGPVAGHIWLDDLRAYLAQRGYCFKSVGAEFYAMDEDSKIALRKAIEQSGIAGNVDDCFTKVMVRDYVVNIAPVDHPADAV